MGWLTAIAQFQTSFSYSISHMQHRLPDRDRFLEKADRPFEPTVIDGGNAKSFQGHHRPKPITAGQPSNPLPDRVELRSTCALQMSEQLAAVGYELICYQTTPGQWDGRVLLTRDPEGNDNCMYLTIEINVGCRFLGKRNMNVTCLATMTEGDGGWRTQDMEIPTMAGFHPSEELSNFFTKSGCKMLACLMPRHKFLAEAENYLTAKQIIAGSNLCRADLYRNNCWVDEFMNRLAGGTPGESMLTLSLRMLDTAEHVTQLPNFNELEVMVGQALPGYVDRIRKGEDVTVQLMAQELSISQTALSARLKSLLNITPGKLIQKIKTEIVIRLLQNTGARRTAGIADGLQAAANFVHWDARSARTNLDRLGYSAAEIKKRPA